MQFSVDFGEGSGSCSFKLLFSPDNENDSIFLKYYLQNPVFADILTNLSKYFNPGHDNPVSNYFLSFRERLASDFVASCTFDNFMNIFVKIAHSPNYIFRKVYCFDDSVFIIFFDMEVDSNNV